jgi:transcriptional/translational regulatory protein YebC/TACO1
LGEGISSEVKDEEEEEEDEILLGGEKEDVVAEKEERVDISEDPVEFNNVVDALCSHDPIVDRRLSVLLFKTNIYIYIYE